MASSHDTITPQTPNLEGPLKPCLAWKHGCYTDDDDDDDYDDDDDDDDVNAV